MYVFLQAIYRYYGENKSNYIKAINYFKAVSELNSFALQYSLLDGDERRMLCDYVRLMRDEYTVVVNVGDSNDSVGKSDVVGRGRNVCVNDNDGMNITSSFVKDKDDVLIKIQQLQLMFN